MTVLSVAFLKTNPDQVQGLPIVDLDYDNAENVSVGASHQETTGSAPTGSKGVYLHAVAACRFEIGSAPEASATSPAMAAGQTLFMRCAPGDKVSVIEV